MAKQEITCDDILRELKAGQYRPIYYLMGEEPYYIDLISDYITDNVLNETEKEFNLTVVYGADVDVATIINAAKRYPMMSEHQVVVVKEAQNIRNIEELSYYLQKPLLSTILVICHKHGVLDKRKKLAAEIEKSGILFESRKVKESQLPAFITSYMKRKGIDLEPKATSMLADFVGTDLSRLAGELEKLICKIYEDNALGKLPDARYRALDAQYAKEQDALEIEIAELEKAVTGYEQSQKSAEKFIALIDKYENFDTLTNTMLNEFVEKILVHERARKGSQDTTQEIEIYFNFLGRYIPPSLQPVPLTPEEQEELRKQEGRKDRLHQNYLKRKASGAQKRYEDKIKAKKKAEMDAKKALIRAEDMKKGVFSTIGQLPKEEPRKGSIAASVAV